MKPPLIKMVSDSVAAIDLRGDKQTRPEPETVRIYFPGGEVEVTRTSDGAYWIHAACNDPARAQGTEDVPGFHVGKFVAARLDTRGKHASEAILGDFERPDLYHVALRVERVK